MNIKQHPIYRRLKGSALYGIYWSLMNEQIVRQRQNELQFYRDLLNEIPGHDLVFDIGANQGAKTDLFLRCGCQVVAVDPDEYNQQLLTDTFIRYRFHQKPITVVGAAVGAQEGEELFWVDEDGGGKNTLSQKWVNVLRNDEGRFGHTLGFGKQSRVRTVTLDSLIAQYGVPKFIKIDVEGYEFEVLRGLSYPVGGMSFEVNLPEFRGEGAACIEQLSTLGPGVFNFSYDVSADEEFGERWSGREEFERLYLAMQEPSVEIFWRGAK